VFVYHTWRLYRSENLPHSSLNVKVARIFLPQKPVQTGFKTGLNRYQYRFEPVLA
jgi:hypothetical protein